MNNFNFRIYNFIHLCGCLKNVDASIYMSGGSYMEVLLAVKNGTLMLMIGFDCLELYYTGCSQMNGTVLLCHNSVIF